MKRLIVRHCRDDAVSEDYKWEIWCKDTHDPLAEPLFVGFGDWPSCMMRVRTLTWLTQQPNAHFHWGGFSCPMSEV